MKEIAKKILIDELIEDSHFEAVEDVIVWALEAYSKKDSGGAMISFAIVQRIKDAEDSSKCVLWNPEKVKNALSQNE
ncbi:MAG: hypothetical protein HRT70_09580 [Flavobacteriaceae bacterium]|nr:hypothetical protein [Flavobacteriaceae bacterium]